MTRHFVWQSSKIKTGENLYIAEELQSFKKLMSLRRSTSNQLIRNLIGYDPEKLCQEIIRRADAKWSERKGETNITEGPITYRRKSDNILITWNSLWYNNLLYSECKIHHTINTPEHIRAFHYNKIPPNINDILIEGYEVHEKIKKSESALKGKLYKFV